MFSVEILHYSTKLINRRYANKTYVNLNQVMFQIKIEEQKLLFQLETGVVQYLVCATQKRQTEKPAIEICFQS